ncbi:hypothetical protein ACHAPU_001083 [Fusarium lateritium]
MSQEYVLPGFEVSLGLGSLDLGTRAESNDSVIFLGERRVTDAGPSPSDQDTMNLSYCEVLTGEPEEEDDPDWSLFVGEWNENAAISTLRMKPEYMSKFKNPFDPWAKNTAAAAAAAATTAPTSAPEPGTSISSSYIKSADDDLEDCIGMKKLSIDLSSARATPRSLPERTTPRLAFVHCKVCHEWRPKSRPHLVCESSEQPSSTRIKIVPTRRRPAPSHEPSRVSKRQQGKKRVRLILRRGPRDQ